MLYNPCEARSERIPTIPLSLLSIGTVLKREGFAVKVIDARIDEKAHEKALALAKDALFFGVTSITGSALFDALEISGKMRQAGVPVVWGGFHASLYPRQTLESKSIDAVCIGQSEEAIVALARELSRKKPKLSRVRGIWFKESGGKIVQNKPAVLQDLNSFPELDYNLVDAEKYIRPDIAPRTLDYISSRGCPHACTFCSIQTVYGMKYRALRPERVVSEIAGLAKKYNANGFHLMDDNFYVDRKRVEKICDLLIGKNLGLKFWTACRVNYFVSFPKGLLEKMRKAGIDTINFGAESGSDRMLSLLRKGISGEQIVKAAGICRQFGFNSQFSFMMGFPQEKPEDFNQTLSIMDKIHSISPKAEMMMFTFTPFPGTELFEESMRQGLEVPKSLEEWGHYKYEHSITPWLSESQKKLFDTLSYLSWFAFAPGIEAKLRKPHLKAAFKVLRAVALFRWKHRIFSLPIEWKLVDKFVSRK